MRNLNYENFNITSVILGGLHLNVNVFASRRELFLLSIIN